MMARPVASAAPIPSNEEARLAALASYGAIGRVPEAEFDHIVALAAELFHVPIALVSLVERDHQWFKARVGLQACETNREVSFCAHAIVAEQAVFVVADAQADPRFAANPLVTGEPFIRFYAGAPLVTSDGFKLGSFCIIDQKPRPEGFSSRDAMLLTHLARLAMERLELRRAQLAQTVAQVRIERLTASSPAAIICADHKGLISAWNAAAETLFGYAANEAIGRSLDLIVPEPQRFAHTEGMRRLAAGGTPRLVGRTIEITACRRNGMEFPVELSLSTWQDVDGPAFGAIMRDITERKRAEGELRRTRAFLDTVVESVPASLFVKSAADGRYLLLNRAAEILTGVPRDEVLGRTDHDIFPGPIADLFTARDRQVLRSGEICSAEEQVPNRDKGVRTVLSRRLSILGDDGAPEYLLGFAEDISDRKAAEARIAHMSDHDGLTGLANRSSFRERLQQSLMRLPGGAGSEGLALLFVDINRFRAVNETLGPNVGDRLLQLVAARLEACTRPADIVARLGGDQFALLAATTGRPGSAERLARRVIKAIGGKPYAVADRQVAMSASVGIALGPSDGSVPDELMKAAALSLQRAKSEGGAAYRFVEAALDARVQRHRALELDLRQGLDRGEFEVHYQPLVRVRSAEIIGVEALLRWRHPERGMVSPSEFIPIAEETGVIVALGEWALRQACTEVAHWPGGTIRVAVNLSPVQVRRGDILKAVSSALRASGLPASRLELEITETVLLADDTVALATLHRLRNLGVRISMDDFGTGYSSLSYLQRFPFDKIKVDQSFVRDMAGDPGAMAIVRAVVGLGQTLGRTTTAEGVETAEQLDILRAVGCEEAQGYLFSRPRPAAEILGQIVSRSPPVDEAAQVPALLGQAEGMIASLTADGEPPQPFHA